MTVFRTEVSRVAINWIVTGTLALFVFCVVNVYLAHEQMVSTGQDALTQQVKESNQIQLLGEFIRDTSPILERSTNRSIKIQDITGYKKTEVISEQAKNSWHSLSATARLEASQDAALLDRYSDETVPLSVAARKGLASLLHSEIGLWEGLDRYMDAKSAVPRSETTEEEAFQSFTKALLTYTQSIASVGALYKQTGDRILMAKSEAQFNYERQVGGLDRLRTRFNLAFLGMVVTFFVITLYVGTLIYFALKAKHAEGSKVGKSQQDPKIVSARKRKHATSRGGK